MARKIFRYLTQKTFLSMQNSNQSKKPNAISVVIQILIAILNALASMFGSTAKVIGLTLGK